MQHIKEVKWLWINSVLTEYRLPIIGWSEGEREFQRVGKGRWSYLRPVYTKNEVKKKKS